MNQYHRYFIQYMLRNGIKPVDDAMEYCKHISQGEIDNPTSFKSLAIEINRAISLQSYKLSFQTCEVTNQDLVIWTSTSNDEISRLQLNFSAVELEYFHSILQEILNSENHTIPSIVCINITSTLTANFSRERGEKVLDKWLKGGYYVMQDGNIYLGPRTIVEFTSYLKTHCPDCTCALCEQLVIVSRQCNCCGKKFHKYCIEKYINNRRNECPTCHNEWIENEIPEEEEVVPASQKRNKRHKPTTIESESSDDEQPGPSSRVRTESPCF